MKQPIELVDFRAVDFYTVTGRKAFSGPSPIAAADREELARKLVGKAFIVDGHVWTISGVECGGAKVEVGRPIGLLVE